MRKKILWSLIFAIILLLILNRFFIINIYIPTASMENTIQIGDRLIGIRRGFWSKDIKRFDIVVIKDPFDEDRLLVKRIIGLPNETLKIENGKIYINNSENALTEQYLKEDWTQNCDGYMYDIPENKYLLLGDNRNDSLDSRLWDDKAESQGAADWEEYAYISQKSIIAKVVFKYYPQFELLD